MTLISCSASLLATTRVLVKDMRALVHLTRSFPTRIHNPSSPLCRRSIQTFRSFPFRPSFRQRCSLPTRPTTLLLGPKQSAVEPITLLIAITTGFAAGYIADSLYSHPPPSTKPELLPDTPASSTPPDASEPHTDPDMAPTSLEGRPGNLTPDQEERLRELWLATLDVFGVTAASRPSVDTASIKSSTAPAAEDKTKKKSKLSMFSRKTKDTKDATEDDNDKHGQANEFRQALQNQSPESLRTAFWGMVKHDDPDALLLRFLRARKWDVHAALVMMISTLHWRSEEMHVDDDIVYKGEGGAAIDAQSSTDPTTKKDAEDFLTQLRMGKSFLHGTDADGRPVCVVRARLHRAGEQTEKSLERFTVYTIDTARMMLRPPIDTAVSLISFALAICTC
jgi:hypothetical protein